MLIAIFSRTSMDGERHAGELAALVGVENFRLAIAGQCFFRRLDAKIGLHADRHAMAEYLAAEPVHDRHKIDEALVAIGV